MNEFETPQESWDFKKILVFLLIVGLLGYGFKSIVLDNKTKEPQHQVEGISTKEPVSREILPKEEIKKSIQENFVQLQKEVNNINVVEIATSTPAVQKVLSDFKNLQSLPQSEAKKACFTICEGIQ